MKELILIVEDNDKNLKLARDLLRFHGFETIEATSAEDGITLAHERKPDLVLMDIQLPGMDGVSALYKLREDKETAARKIAWLETQGVEFIEQPMPAAMLDEQRWLRSRVHMPILADEACLRSQDIPKIADAYDGIVVKVDKAGGLLEALRSIHTARSFGLKVMLGCMVSSSVAITAAAHLSPLVDYADLDGNLLIGNDPYTGVLVKDGKLVLPAGPGLGLVPAA